MGSYIHNNLKKYFDYHHDHDLYIFYKNNFKNTDDIFIKKYYTVKIQLFFKF